MKTRVGVKFCGNCNPYFNSGDLIKRLKTDLPEIEFVKYDEEPFEVLLVFSGCESNCVSKQNSRVPEIIVAGYTLNHYKVDPKDLYSLVKKQIKETVQDYEGR